MAKVTQRVYDAAKILLESGNNQAETGRYLKLSSIVVKFIANTESYEEYQTVSYEYWANKKQKNKAIYAKQAEKASEQAKEPEQIVQLPTPVQQKPISMTIQATHFMETKLDQVIDLLKIMNNKLGAIIDDLYGTGSGKDGAAHG